eukprot:552339-Hanusia_phi.AAC.2
MDCYVGGSASGVGGSAIGTEGRASQREMEAGTVLSQGCHVPERNQDATIYVGNITEKCTEEILWELFLQAGPVVNVHIPRDKVTTVHSGFGFVEFRSEEDAEYAIKIMNMIKLHGQVSRRQSVVLGSEPFPQPLRLNKKASGEIKVLDVGANLFIGTPQGRRCNLEPEVDEKLLYDTFSAFGVIVGNTPKCMRDPETGQSKVKSDMCARGQEVTVRQGFAFVNYDCFEAADMAIEVDGS